MEGPAKKRSRTENYTQEDTFKLIECVAKYKHIVENKKTDAVTWKQKDEAWNKISQEYNSSSTNGRTPKQLRGKFEALKKETRKSAAAERQCMLQTGGGPLTVVKPNPILDKVREMIQFSTEGLPSIFDSDSMSELPVVTVLLEGTDNMNEHNADAQGSRPRPNINFEGEVDLPVISPEDVQNYQHQVESTIPVMELSYTGSTGAEDVESCSTAVVSAQNNECDNDWSSYSPRMLKKRKSSPLRNALTKVKNSSPTVNSGQSSTRTSSVSGQKLSSWVTEKKCLASLQQELLKKQFAQREKREQELHKIEIQIKKAQLKSLKMDIQIKRKTLNNIQNL